MSGPGETIVDAALLRSLPLPVARDGGGKEERGRVLVVGGSREVPGAALLAGTAVLRAGAGKLQVGAPKGIAVPLGLALPEAMVVGLAETDLGGIAAEAGDRVVTLAARCRALLIGPGLVEDDDTASLTRDVLERLDDVPMVIDAAAMMRLVEAKPALARHAGRIVVTPHHGEMASILSRDRAEVEADPAALASEVATDLGVVVVLKSACTHVAVPDGRVFASRHGHIGLATSGSGDTLAGLIAGLIGRGAEPLEAAIWGVFVHGEAGRRLAARVGPLGFLAREIPDEVPAILAGLCGEEDRGGPSG